MAYDASEAADDAPLDVLVIGAGLSGVGAAHHVRTRLPRARFLVLEGREAVGGTWDLFRYPGVRSDSDMHTLGYAFRPWRQAKAIADGASILDYIRETAAEHGVSDRIRFRHRVRAIRWSSADALWSAEVETPDGPRTFRARWIMSCTGYFDYGAGYTPPLPGLDAFAGRVAHPQHWPADLDCAGRRVVVVGSGATAVTLVPALARTAAHVVMLQRSPTYVVARPSSDALADALRGRLPARLAYGVVRWRNVLLSLFLYHRIRKHPVQAKKLLIDMARKQLKPGYDVETHFTPSYDPWDQRVCLAPDADLFTALNEDRASVVTGRIDRVLPTGVRLEDGRELPCDVLVTATGLTLQPLSAMDIEVDGRPVRLGETLNYRGAMISDTPNLAAVFGYTNASWTLKADLVSAWVCRVLAYMDRRGFGSATPENTDPQVTPEPFLSFTSGYVQRSIGQFPRQGSKPPWRLHQNYVRDILTLRYARLNDGVLRFRRPGERVGAAEGAAATAPDPPIPAKAG